MDTHLVLFVHATMAQCSHKCPVCTKKHAHSSNYGKKTFTPSFISEVYLANGDTQPGGGSGSMQIHNLLPRSRFPRVDGGGGELLAYKRVGCHRRSVSRVQREGQDHLIKVKPVSLIWHVIRELPGRRRRLRIFPPSPGLVWGKKELCVCCCWHDCEV